MCARVLSVLLNIMICVLFACSRKKVSSIQACVSFFPIQLGGIGIIKAATNTFTLPRRLEQFKRNYNARIVTIISQIIATLCNQWV